MSVHVFRYEATDSAGKTRRGRVEAPGEAEAFRALVAQGLVPAWLEPATGGSATGAGPRAPGASTVHPGAGPHEDASGSARPRRAGAIRRSDVASLTRELASLVEARVPLAQGLLAVAENEQRPALRAMLLDIGAMIEAGESLPRAVEKYDSVFGRVFVMSLEAAERSGNLAAVLTMLADMLERQEASSQQLRRALSYPVIVASFVGLALLVIVTFVIPRFAATFAASGVDLPLTTRVMQAVGQFIREYWWACAGGVLALIAGGATALRTPGGRALAERGLLVTPVVRDLVIAVTAARFSRVMAISLGSGVGVIDSMRLSAQSTGRPLFAAEADDMAERLRGGSPLKDVLETTRYLPPFARRMISCGKQASEIGNASAIVARHYDRQSEHLTKAVNTLVEPLMTVGLAVVVLVVALSVFLPMWQMVKLVR